MIPTSFPFHQVAAVIPNRPGADGLGRDVDFDGSNASHSGDAGDADLGGELYTRKKKPSGALSASGQIPAPAPLHRSPVGILLTSRTRPTSPTNPSHTHIQKCTFPHRCERSHIAHQSGRQPSRR